MRTLIFGIMVLVGASQQAMASGFGAYPPMPGMAAPVPPLNGLYPPLSGVAPNTNYPQSGAGNRWAAPQAGSFPAPSMPQNGMGGMPSSLFPMFQQQMMPPSPPLSAVQPPFNGGQSLQQGSNNGWPKPPQQTPYDVQGASSLDGMWQGTAGEMIAIKDNRFLYSDKGSQKFSGYLSIGRDRFQASIPSNKTVANYHYWIKDDKLTVRDEAGRMLYFQRVSR